jgi:hypothetical protein
MCDRASLHFQKISPRSPTGTLVPSFDNSEFGHVRSFTPAARRLARENFNGESWFEERSA